MTQKQDKTKIKAPFSHIVSNNPVSPTLHCHILRKVLLLRALFGSAVTRFYPFETFLLSLSPNNFNWLQVQRLLCSHLLPLPPHQSVTLELCDEFAS